MLGGILLGGLKPILTCQRRSRRALRSHGRQMAMARIRDGSCASVQRRSPPSRRRRRRMSRHLRCHPRCPPCHHHIHLEVFRRLRRRWRTCHPQMGGARCKTTASALPTTRKTTSTMTTAKSASIRMSLSPSSHLLQQEFEVANLTGHQFVTL